MARAARGARSRPTPSCTSTSSCSASTSARPSGVAIERRFSVGDAATTARIYRAPAPRDRTLVLAHGAGAGQTHPFMCEFAEALAARGIDVVTFDFLYVAAGRRLPDKNDALEACW